MIYKNFKKFLEEVDLTQYSGGEPINPGLPKEFFSSLEEPLKSNFTDGYAARILTYKDLENNKKDINSGLEEIAKEVLKEYYSDFFEQKNISLEIKISSGDEIYDFYEKNKIVKESDFDYIKNLSDEDIKDVEEIDDIEDYDNNVNDKNDIDFDADFDDDSISFESLVNENKLTKLAIHKMKLINNIVQGEGLNTKALINLPETKEKLVELYSKYESKESAESRVNKLIILWNSFADFMKSADWERGDSKPKSIPPGSAYGACAVDIGQNKDNSSENDNNTFEDDDITFEKLILESTKPQIIIKSRGIDFAMLLHETVKGIYSLAYSTAFKDEDLVKKLSIATGGIADETQDFKYGPIIAADLRDFINDIIDKNKNDVKYENYASIRLFTYKKLCELESEEFLQVFKGILYKGTKSRLEKRHKNKDFPISKDTEDYILFSEKKITNIVDMVIDKLLERQSKKEEKERRKREWDEYQKQLKEWEEYEKNKKSSPITQKIEVDEEKEDRSKWTKEDYNNAINNALENNDIPRLTLISNEMKSKKMYENVYTKYKKFKINK